MLTKNTIPRPVATDPPPTPLIVHLIGRKPAARRDRANSVGAGGMARPDGLIRNRHQ
jgi:hypothetical protein